MVLKDLRIGNIIKALLYVDHGDVYIHYVDPVEITEDILNKIVDIASVQTIRERIYYYFYKQTSETNLEFCIVQDEGKFYSYIGNTYAFNKLNQIKYLHQLQNLYYFMFNRELQINI